MDQTTSFAVLLICLAALLLLGGRRVGAGAPGASLPRSRPAARLRHHTATCVIVPGTRAQVDGLAARHGLTIRKRLKTGAVIEIPAGALAAVAADAGLDSLTSNYRLQPHMAVTTAAIGADQVWSDGWAAGAPGLTGSGIGVAVIDTGVANVPELKNRIVVSVDFTGSSGGSGQAVGRAGCGGAGTAVQGRAGDDNGHGTHVAGIIAAAGVNAKDITSGVAPGANIINLKVLGADGSGYASDVADAIDWAIDESRPLQDQGHQPVAGRAGAPALRRRSGVPGRRARLSGRDCRRGRPPATTARTPTATSCSAASPCPRCRHSRLRLARSTPKAPRSGPTM